MFKNDYLEAPRGTLAHDGAMLHLACLRLIVALRQAFGIRRLERWLANPHRKD